MKKCIGCKLYKSPDLYYKHPKTKDGLNPRCKSCCKKAARDRYAKKKEYVQTYEKMRNQTPERKAKRQIYQQNRRIKNPGKYRARNAVNNALRDGRLTKLPCVECGDPNSEGHHTDYRKPLKVTWLCFSHHRKAHGQNT